MTTEPNREVRQRIGRVLGHVPRRFHAVRGGYTPAQRWLVECASGVSAFAKVATSAGTADALRAEARTYERLHGPFMPRYFGWEDDDQAPILLIEDLRGARWPPPWDDALVAGVRESLSVLHGADAELPVFRDAHGPSTNGWSTVATDPEPFLGLGLVTASALEKALPDLVRAGDAVDPSGSAPAHFDVRSDNLCSVARGVVLVDWNLACLGNPRLDLGFWLPSLEAEGGPKPETILPDAPEIAARVSGFFAARAGLPPVLNAPRVRWVQRQQLETALSWACRALGLPPMLQRA